MKILRWTLISLLVALLAMTFVVACGDDDDDDDDNDTSSDDDDDDNDDNDDDDTVDPFVQAEENPGTWVWVPVEGAVCRDGSPTGFGLRLQDGADKLVVYMQGGGACYDQGSCDDNPSSFGENDMTSWAPGNGFDGILNDDNTANPVKDYNFVFVPYCTGDLHVGSNPDSFVPGVDGTQQFVGFGNFGLFMDKIKPYFTEITKIFLTGESAGGFGTVLNYTQVADTFDTLPVAHLDDSGPLFADDDALAPCYQALVRYMWNVDESIPDGCTDCSQVNGDGISNMHIYLANTYTNGSFGLFSTTADETIRDFFGAGQDDCSGTTPIPADVFEDGLIDLRDNVLEPTGKWSTYFVDDDYHTIIHSEPEFYTTTVDSVALTDWIADILAGTPSQVGP